MIEAFLLQKARSGHLGGTGKAADKAGSALGPASVRRLHVTLHKALDSAVRKGLLHRNPVDLADKPRVPAVDVTLKVWAPAEVVRFIGATSADRLFALWRLDAMTGLRRSEVCALQWPDLDLEGGRLSVRRAVVIVDGIPVVKSPKTERSRRSVDLDAKTVALLREHRRLQLEERLRAVTAWTAGEWVFTNEIGEPLNPNWLGLAVLDFGIIVGPSADHHAPAPPQSRDGAPECWHSSQDRPGAIGSLLDLDHFGHLFRRPAKHAT